MLCSQHSLFNNSGRNRTKFESVSFCYTVYDFTKKNLAGNPLSVLSKLIFTFSWRKIKLQAYKNLKTVEFVSVECGKRIGIYISNLSRKSYATQVSGTRRFLFPNFSRSHPHHSLTTNIYFLRINF